MGVVCGGGQVGLWGKGGGETEKGDGCKSPTSDLGLVSWAVQRD